MHTRLSNRFHAAGERMRVLFGDSLTRGLVSRDAPLERSPSGYSDLELQHALGTNPATYARNVRLNRVRRELLRASLGSAMRRLLQLVGGSST